jgi:protein TonB
MEPKKNPKINLEKKRGLFLQIGLALALLLVLGAFEYRSYEKSASSLGDIILEADWEEDIENTFREKKTPPPPPEEIIIMEDDKEIEEVKIEATESGEDDEIEEEVEETVDEVFISVEDMPLFEGCLDNRCTDNEIRKFIAYNTKYPAIARENNITGKVYVNFVVNKSGKVVDARIVRSVDKYLDKEALRVISSMPLFTPGKQRGKVVRVQYNVPITFSLN